MNTGGGGGGILLFMDTHPHRQYVLLGNQSTETEYKAGDIWLNGDGLASGVVWVSHQSHDELLHHEYEAVVLHLHKTSTTVVCCVSHPPS